MYSYIDSCHLTIANDFLDHLQPVSYAYLGPPDMGQGGLLITGGNPPKEGDVVKFIKVIGLTGVAAIVAMAFVGVGTASATGLCSAAPSGASCNAGTAYKTGQTYEAEAVNALLKTNLENVTCATSKTTLKQTQENTGAGVALLGEITALTFSGCKSSGGFSCTVLSVNAPYKASLLSSTGLLSVTAKTGEPSASVSCAGGLLACVFGNTTFELPLVSGNPAEVKAEGVPLKMTKKTGFLNCPTSSEWIATYVAKTPASIWVSES